MSFSIESDAFVDGAPIPSKYTCDGADVSPALGWSGVPDGARSLALICEDPDAPDPAAPTRVWVHWVLYNVPAKAARIGEAAAAAELPPGCELGRNDWGRLGYGGPCPPIGRHRYFFKLYALDTTLTGLSRPTAAELRAAMRGHILAEAELIGTYEKRGR